MSFTSHSDEAVRWQSAVTVESKEFPGVRLRVARPSLMRRADLTRRVRELVEKAQCLAAGDQPSEKLSAAMLSLEADRVYVEWGVLEVQGLAIDDEPATVRALIERGPETLCREAAEAVRREAGLSEDERKN